MKYWRLCGSCGGRCKARKLDRAISATESFSRFIFENGHYYKEDGRPKQKAFQPAPYKGEMETSVGRLDQAGALRIRHLGINSRYPKTAIGRAVITPEALKKAELYAKHDPMLCYHEHAVIKGWPIAPDPKALWKVTASVLVKHSTPIIFLEREA